MSINKPLDYTETAANLVSLAAAYYGSGDLLKSFDSLLAALAADPLDPHTQIMTIKMINRVNDNGISQAVERWIQSCSFGNIKNAAIIVPTIADSPGEIYIICSYFSSIVFRLGYVDLSLEVFSHCLSDDLPCPPDSGATQADYGAIAAAYDDDPMHRAGVDVFLDFLRRHLNGRDSLDIVDAPCGTGLAGPALFPLARTLTGCDLSPDMLSVARRRECYDTLVQGDLIETLSGIECDLLVCLGSLHHFRDIDPVAAAAASALRGGGGLFAFSDFLAPHGVMATIGGNLRYCRSRERVVRSLSAAGLGLVAFEPVLSYGLPGGYWLFRKP